MKKIILLSAFILSFTFQLFSQSNNFIPAYDTMHRFIRENYPFGQWKAIKWEEIDNRIRPAIVQAASTNDTVAYYLALKRYVASIHDGHVGLKGTGWKAIDSIARYRYIGGSFGFALTEMDDGRLVARLVLPSTPAALAGMQYGAEIISINDQPAKNVRDTVEVLFGDSNPATLECKRMNQDRLVGRAPVGKSMKIKFRNRGSADPVETTIVAVDDHYESFDKTTMGFVEPGPIVSYKILDPEKYGYLKMTDMGTDSASRAEHYQTFREAITEFNNAGSRGMILDLRVNRGGYDMLAAVLSGFFQTDTSLYEYNYLYDYDSHSFSINPYPVPHFKPANLGTYFNPNYPDGALFIEPSGQTFSKPVMVLVSPRAVSSGEGLPMILKRNPGNKIIGFHGTNGSFGILIGIPGIDQYYFFPSRSDMYIRFPWALSADKNLKVQIDSDSTMTGGVTPNILIPMTDSIMDLMYVDSIDVELNRAIQELNSLQGIGENATGSQDVILDQNYPNPAGENTVITFCLKQPSDVSLTVQDLYGRRVQTLLSGFQKPGKHSVTWETKGLASGLYIYKLQAAGRIVSRKMILR